MAFMFCMSTLCIMCISWVNYRYAMRQNLGISLHLNTGPSLYNANAEPTDSLVYQEIKYLKLMNVACFLNFIMLYENIYVQIVQIELFFADFHLSQSMYVFNYVQTFF